jgi:hypothetical protein
MNKQNAYLTTAEASDYLGVSKQWLEAGRSAGFGAPFIKVGSGGGGVIRYKRTVLDAWMLENQQTNSSEGI